MSDNCSVQISPLINFLVESIKILCICSCVKSLTSLISLMLLPDSVHIFRKISRGKGVEVINVLFLFNISICNNFPF